MVNLESLIIEYGKSMMTLGKGSTNLHSETLDNSPIKLKLKRNPLFLQCPGNIQVAILEYGYQCAMYGYCKEKPDSPFAQDTLNKYGNEGPQFHSSLSEYITTHNTPLTLSSYKLTSISDIKELITEYGKAMITYGMLNANSQENNLLDPTDDLKKNPLYINCPKDIQEDIEKYGRESRYYGQGLYNNKDYSTEVFYRYCETKGPQVYTEETNGSQFNKKFKFIKNYIESHNTLATINNLESLIKEYGKSMATFGMQFKFTNIQETNPSDPTIELKKNPLFLQCPGNIQEDILEHGSKSKLYGMGSQEKTGYAVDFFNKHAATNGPQMPTWLKEYIDSHGNTQTNSQQTHPSNSFSTLGNSLGILFKESLVNTDQNTNER